MTNTNETMHSHLFGVKNMALIGVMVAIFCILAPLSIPIGPVPISLSVLVVYLAAYVLGPIKGSLAVLIYILLGLIGLPVFSGYFGGAAKLFGPTGGYIMSYVLMCLVSGYFIEKFPFRKGYFHFLGMIFGLILCYVLGTLWFSIVLDKTFSESLAICVYPFVMVDLIKIISAFFLGNGVKEGLRKAGL